MTQKCSDLQALMPDTIGLAGLWELKEPLNPDEWTVETKNLLNRTQERTRWRAYRHQMRHPNIYGIDEAGKFITRIECSLPALINGHNGKLIATEHSLRQAIGHLKDFIDSIATPVTGSLPVVCRLDFAWQVSIDAQGILAGYERIKLKRGRKMPEVHPGESVRWNLGDYCFQIYDKTKQMRAKGCLIPSETKDVLRFELQLRSQKAVAEAFQKNEVNLEDLAMERIYRVFRRFIVERLPDTNSIQFGDGKLSRSQLLAVVLALFANEKVNGSAEGIVEFAYRVISPRSIRTLRRQVASIRLGRNNFVPSEVFPVSLHDLQGVNLLTNGTIEPVSTL